jgi:hypothetical protein
MTAIDGQGGCDAGLGQVRARCRALGLPTWVFDASGVMTAEPEEDGVAGTFLRSPGFREDLAAALRDRRERSWTMRELFRGCHVVALEERRGRRVDWLVVAAALGPEVVESPRFAAICASAGVVPALAARALEPLASYPARGVDRVGTMLGWMRDDLSQAARDRRSIDQHGVQLTEMYEEIGLLYRIGRSMNSLTAPDVFIRQTCDDLAETLPFGWVAAKFGRSPRVAPELAGTLTISGRPPIDRSTLDLEAESSLKCLAPARWSLFPEGGGASLAVACGSQVLAHPISRGGQVVGALLAGNKRGDDPEVSGYETQLLDAAADYVGVFAENAGLYAEQRAMFLGIVRALTAAIDAKDRYTRGHSERVAHLARGLAIASGLTEAQAERVHLAGLLHDVGKIGVRESVLCKPGRLDRHEFDLVKQHPEIGHRILRDIPGMEDVLPGVLHHHERWDGRGYPHGQAGEAIAPIARMLAVADSFDAMSSNRSYRAAMPRPEVLAEILRCAGTQFDPDLARRFVTLDLAEYDEMVGRHRGDDAAIAA